MKKLLFIVYYDLKDYLLYIKEQFEKYHIEVITYPLFRYAYDVHDKLPNYKEHLNKFVIENDPDIILWWFIDVPVDIFKYVVQSNKNKYFIIYNSDDPLNLSKAIFDKCKYFNLVVTPCKGTIYKYKLFSNNNDVVFGPFGFDPNLHYRIQNIDNYNKNTIALGSDPDSHNQVKNINEYNEEADTYSCDISMYCHNLYINKDMYPSQYICALDLISKIVEYSKKNNKTFRLYGTYIMKEYFPDNYIGDLDYLNVNFLYNFSKINIVTHGNCDSNLSINQYIMPILGSGGLLLIDKIKDIEKLLTDGKNCVIIENDNYINQIDTILNNYDDFINIRNNAREFALVYSWDEWVKQIIVQYSTDNFNKVLYASLYNLDEDDDLLTYWKNEGIDNGEICYDFIVPDNFSADDYTNKYKLTNKSKEYAYLHWYTNNKNEIYLKHRCSNITNFNPELFGVTMDQYHAICLILSKLKNYDNKKKTLIELNNYCGCIPSVKINDIVNQYVS